MKKIFYHGTIVTMEPELYAPAVLIAADRIEKIGTLEALQQAAPTAELVDLAGATMLPAFLDAHGHFSSYANGQLQIPLAGVTSLAELSQRIEDFCKKNPPAVGGWLVGSGYDHNTLAEKRQPDLALLDALAPENPLILQHQSGHCGVVNSCALAALGLTPATPAPAGGFIGCEDGKLTGYLEEAAYLQGIRQVPMADLPTLLAAYGKAQECYLAQGITTVQEGMMVAQMIPLFQGLLASGLLSLDLVGYGEPAAMAALQAAFPKSVGKYDRHFKIGGYKIILDGSPQVKTAWLRTPYLTEAVSDAASVADTTNPGTQSTCAGYCGYGTMTDDAVFAAISQATAAGMQILAHCNGDGAIQQFMAGVAQVAAQQPAVLGLKPVIIHGQFMGTDQLPMVARLGIIPSFFVAHVLHWGDIHVKNVGYERAKTISPAHAALLQGLPFTFHQDAPVIEPNMLETIQCAVTRCTKTGQILGAEECISVLDALKAVTIQVAAQYGEEATKGSIHPGKQADFVILQENPLTVPPATIGKIGVLATIKGGKTLWCRENPQKEAASQRR